MTALTASRRTWIGGGAIALAAALAYSNSFSGVFTLDDGPSILDNASIRHLWPLGPVLAPAHGGMTVSGRPLLNLSLAINYALGGLNPWGYHAFNLLVHILAGWALWGVVGRTLRKIGAPGGEWLALAVALVWTVHPLQTESVTYVIQRAEALMGLFYLLTLYCFIRFSDETLARSATGTIECTGTRQRFVWAAFSVVACLLGMATKEVMVSAPVIVLLYDRTFVGGSFREAWRRRQRYYLCLAGTWILLGWLVVQSGNRGGTSGWGTGVDPGRYWLTQFPAAMHYLRLSFWPHPLIFDYGTIWVRSAASAWLPILTVLVLAGLTLYGLAKRTTAGFLGACFFAVLAPTSLIPGNRQVMAEHRMYLALAPVLVLAVWGIARVGARHRLLILSVLLALAVPLGFLTYARNRVYRSELALSADTVAKLPTNNFAQVAYGLALADVGRLDEAISHYEVALELNPAFSDAYNDMGLALYRRGKLSQAIAYYRQAVKMNPADPVAHNDLGVALSHHRDSAGAMAEYRAAVSLKPYYSEAWDNIGNLLRQQSKTDEAIAAYERALQYDPHSSLVSNNLGVALASAGRLPEAIAYFQQAVEAKADYPEAENNLGRALIDAGRPAEAVTHLRAALRLRPGYANAHYNLGLALKALGNVQESFEELEAASRLR